jgi:hypothetical protein
MRMARFKSGLIWVHDLDRQNFWSCEAIATWNIRVGSVQTFSAHFSVNGAKTHEMAAFPRLESRTGLSRHQQATTPQAARLRKEQRGASRSRSFSVAAHKVLAGRAPEPIFMPRRRRHSPSCQCSFLDSIKGRLKLDCATPILSFSFIHCLRGHNNDTQTLTSKESILRLISTP